MNEPFIEFSYMNEPFIEFAYMNEPFNELLHWVPSDLYEMKN